uniref:Uncharacterized protein n=1 Tax=Candidatus Kentrum sp. UNK TaxID=2126344 RepID=A0A451AQM0_9GAMM|nr:MAG: hypothetical protein BECKUNK1418G_GA0071005_100259 [Candidatus Kentron sp. UNK]VFK68330.1 MAG: hypothetical protein BECKUNK1418H_GA0071006_100159 [Candidatus Kentron sp. UNK]
MMKINRYSRGFCETCVFWLPTFKSAAPNELLEEEGECGRSGDYSEAYGCCGQWRGREVFGLKYSPLPCRMTLAGWKMLRKRQRHEARRERYWNRLLWKYMSRDLEYARIADSFGLTLLWNKDRELYEIYGKSSLMIECRATELLFWIGVSKQFVGRYPDGKRPEDKRETPE